MLAVLVVFGGFALLPLGCVELGWVLLVSRFVGGSGWVSDWLHFPSLFLGWCAGLPESFVVVLCFEGLLAVPRMVGLADALGCIAVAACEIGQGRWLRVLLFDSAELEDVCLQDGDLSSVDPVSTSIGDDVGWI